MKNPKPDPLAKISILIAKQQDIDYGNLVRLITLQYLCVCLHIKYVLMTMTKKFIKNDLMSCE